MTQDEPKNRKERRVAARQTGSAIQPPTSTPKMKMVQPDRSKPQTKTLLDLYDEKKGLRDQGQPFDLDQGAPLSMDEDGNIVEPGVEDEYSTGPAGDAIFWSISLAMLHFTLDVLVYNQYAQRVVWSAIYKRSFTVLPILFVVIYMMRSTTAKRFPLARQALYLAVSVASGCYLIHAGNKYEYFAVMKQAPPLGTIWVWSVIELDLPFAVASVAIDLGFLWWKGYSAF